MTASVTLGSRLVSRDSEHPDAKLIGARLASIILNKFCDVSRFDAVRQSIDLPLYIGGRQKNARHCSIADHSIGPQPMQRTPQQQPRSVWDEVANDRIAP